MDQLTRTHLRLAERLAWTARQPLRETTPRSVFHEKLRAARGVAKY